LRSRIGIVLHERFGLTSLAAYSVMAISDQSIR